MRGLENLQIGAKLGEGWSVDTVCKECGELESECRCHAFKERREPKAHKLHFRLEKRQGKSVTCAGEFFLEESEMKEWLKKLKSSLGCGGTYKGGFIELQGEWREKARAFFEKVGFGLKR